MFRVMICVWLLLTFGISVYVAFCDLQSHLLRHFLGQFVFLYCYSNLLLVAHTLVSKNTFRLTFYFCSALFRFRTFQTNANIGHLVVFYSVATFKQQKPISQRRLFICGHVKHKVCLLFGRCFLFAFPDYSTKRFFPIRHEQWLEQFTRCQFAFRQPFVWSIL